MKDALSYSYHIKYLAEHDYEVITICAMSNHSVRHLANEMGLVCWEESAASPALRWVEPIGKSGFSIASKITHTSDWVEQIFRLKQDHTIPSILAPPSFSNFGISRADPLRIRSGNTKVTIIM